MTLPTRPTVKGLAHERFRVLYHLTGNLEEARFKAQDICLEQTVEFPADLTPAGDIQEQVVGQVESLDEIGANRYAAWISYDNSVAGAEIPQLLNVIFGNISIKAGIRVEKIDLPASLLAAFPGARFGQAGWRELLQIPERPLLCTALKPMGLAADDLAEMAYQCALGGLDIIKDDHGLANQAFAPYEERVTKCAAAVAKANAQTGLRCQYMPNVTAPADQLLARAQFAKEAGAGALLICPGLTGFDGMGLLANNVDLPIMSHPSFYGSMVTSHENGMSHYALYGQLQRLCGADASVYPNFGGRFAFSQAECEAIVAGCNVPMGDLKPIFPAPGGGMNAHNIPEMKAVYGQAVIYLVGGGLHRHSPSLAENARYFLGLIQ